MYYLTEAKRIDKVVADTAALAKDFREKVVKIGLKCPDYLLSNAVISVIFENGKAQEVYKVLKMNTN